MPTRAHLPTLGDDFDCHNPAGVGEGERMLWVPSGWSPRMLLNILEYLGLPTAERKVAPVSAVPRVRSLV